MKDIELIHAPETAEYLQDFMTELPVNCLLDKGRTGCGGTTLALENDKDTIIAMPYVSLIKNKQKQCNDKKIDVISIFSPNGLKECDLKPATNNEIIDYVNTNNKRKILVTYDSLKRLVELLSDNGIDVFNEFYLLIDEWHILFNSYLFREEAITSVLNLAQSFKEVTYMTATPIEDEFILEEMKDLPVKQVIWKNTVEVTVNPIHTNRPKTVVSNLITNCLEGKILGHLHFFVNSVEFIAQVLQGLELNPELVRVICSKNNKLGKGKKSNQAKLGSEYPIAETTDQVKKINFYTSTCFEGCDIYDKDGKTYIVSDGYKSHTLMDIQTLFIQICGRIRDSRYCNEVTHIFSETRYSGDITLEEFKESTTKDLDKWEHWINTTNNMEESDKEINLDMFEKAYKAGFDNKYIRKEGNHLVINRNLIKVDIMNFKISKHLYKSRIVLGDEYQKNNLKVNETLQVLYTDKLASNPKAKISFKDLFDEYATIREANKGLICIIGNPEDRQHLIEQEKPLIKQAYEELGIDRVKALKYNITNIKRELLKRDTDISMDYKILKCLSDSGIGEGDTIPSKELKAILQEIYTSLGRRIKAKATDIKEWFDTKKTSPKINGKSTECYTLIRHKLIYR